jgi:hypothetical protein
MSKISVYNNFNDLPATYLKVFDDAGLASGFFYSHHWFNHLVETSFEKNVTLKIYGLENNIGKTKLALVMFCQPPSVKLLSPKILKSVANYYTSLFGPITGIDSEYLEEGIKLIVQEIVSESPRWDMVDLHPMDISNPSFSLLKNNFRKEGMAVQTYFCFGNWYLDIKGRSFTEYFDTLPARLKNTIIRKTKKLNDSTEWNIKIVTASAELAEYIAIFETIYNSSWKNPEPHPDFIPGLIRICAEQGWLRLGIAYIDNQPAAAQIWIVNNGVSSIYKLAYIDKYSKYSIGTILTARLMEHVIETDKVREVDYLTGDDEYKRDWMSHRRERWGLIAFNLRTPAGILASIKHLGGSAIKRILKLNGN